MRVCLLIPIKTKGFFSRTNHFKRNSSDLRAVVTILSPTSPAINSQACRWCPNFKSGPGDERKPANSAQSNAVDQQDGGGA